MQTIIYPDPAQKPLKYYINPSFMCQSPQCCDPAITAPLTSSISGEFHCCSNGCCGEQCCPGNVNVGSQLRPHLTNLKQKSPEFTFPYSTPYLGSAYKFEDRIPIQNENLYAQGDVHELKGCGTVTGVPFTYWDLLPCDPSQHPVQTVSQEGGSCTRCDRKVMSRQYPQRCQ